MSVRDSQAPVGYPKSSQQHNKPPNVALEFEHLKVGPVVYSPKPGAGREPEGPLPGGPSAPVVVLILESSGQGGVRSSEVRVVGKVMEGAEGRIRVWKARRLL